MTAIPIAFAASVVYACLASAIERGPGLAGGSASLDRPETSTDPEGETKIFPTTRPVTIAEAASFGRKECAVSGQSRGAVSTAALHQTIHTSAGRDARSGIKTSFLEFGGSGQPIRYRKLIPTRTLPGRNQPRQRTSCKPPPRIVSSVALHTLGGEKSSRSDATQRDYERSQLCKTNARRVFILPHLTQQSIQIFPQ